MTYKRDFSFSENKDTAAAGGTLQAKSGQYSVVTLYVRTNTTA